MKYGRKKMMQRQESELSGKKMTKIYVAKATGMCVILTSTLGWHGLNILQSN